MIPGASATSGTGGSVLVYAAPSGGSFGPHRRDAPGTTNALDARMTNSTTVPYSFRRDGRILFQTTGPRVDVSSPEKRLALAVLADAVRQVRAGGHGAADDEAWFASPGTDHPFAFISICDVLGLDPDHLRRGLRRMHRRTPVAHAA